MTDPISDFLTRIRNAQQAGHRKVDVPASKFLAFEKPVGNLIYLNK